MRRTYAFLAVLATIFAGCGKEAPPSSPGALAIEAPGWGLPAATASDRVPSLGEAATAKAGAALAIDYPLDETVYPPDLVPPTVRWTDDTDGVDGWVVEIAPEDGGPPLRALVPGSPPEYGPIDIDCEAPTNRLPDRPGAFAHAWTPSEDLWRAVVKKTTERWARLTITGVASASPGKALSRGHLRFETSKDPVGAPIFYRDVPLAPGKTEKGVIQPLAKGTVKLINWRLRDVSRPESRVVLSHMPTCANCHSFSQDGSTLGMDVDGPDGDKGTYAIVPVKKDVVIGYDDIITWNAFPGKTPGLNTLGFLSRMSPTGRYAVSTVNEKLYVANFTNYEILQVFFPTRGILAWYDRETKEMKALPGADDTDYVHCSAVWTPDGKDLVFARAPAFDPYGEDKPLAAYPGDPNEPRIQYDLYRIPFNGGKGGTPVAIEGASKNGMSNTFPKVSPDGRWLVYVKCHNAQLLRPDGRLWIVPLAGGKAHEMRCNTWRMNSWHSFSPNGHWLVFTSKSNTPYTQMFLTHLDGEGNDTPAVLIPHSTAANRAVNLPEFVNVPYSQFQTIEVPGVEHRRAMDQGLELVKSGRLEDAVEKFEKAVSVNAEYAPARVQLGWALDRLGKKKEAREAFAAAVKVDPTCAAAHDGLGYELLEGEDQDLQGAIDHLEKALDLDRSLTRSLRRLAFALYQAGDLKGALHAYDDWLLREPSSLEAHGAASTILIRLGRRGEAVKHLRAALETAPKDPQVLTSLAWLLATAPEAAVRDGTEAVVLAERLVGGTESPTATQLDTLAAAYAEAGRFTDAVPAAERALERVGTSDSARRAEIETHLEAFRGRRPWRDPPEVLGG